MVRGGMWLTVATAGLMLGACGESTKATPPPSPSGPVPQVAIHGDVDQTNNTYCGQTRDLVSHAQIVFRDRSGGVIGTATVGKATKRSNSSGIFASCGRSGEYAIQVPKQDLYRVTWIGVDQSPRTVSYRELVAKGFKFDLFAVFNEP